MPVDGPRARIKAEIVIVHEAIDYTFGQTNTLGLTVEQVCKLRRTGFALLTSIAAGGDGRINPRDKRRAPGSTGHDGKLEIRP